MYLKKTTVAHWNTSKTEESNKRRQIPNRRVKYQEFSTKTHQPALNIKFTFNSAYLASLFFQVLLLLAALVTPTLTKASVQQ